MSATVRAVTFDLDDTLVDGSATRAAIALTCRDIAAATHGLDEARLVDANRIAWEGYWPGVEERWARGLLSGEAVSLEVWRRALVACGCGDDSLVQQTRDIHARHVSAALRLFDDVPEVLDVLKANGVRFGLITNGASDTQRHALRVLGIEDRFDAVVISGETGTIKPDPAVFRFALERLGAEPAAAWHVGDSLLTDVAGATGAGMTAVWLNRQGLLPGEGSTRPHHEIRTLFDLPALLSAGPTAVP